MDKVQRTVYSKYSMQDVLVLRWSERTVQYKSQPKTKEKRVDRICACQLRVRRGGSTVVTVMRLLQSTQLSFTSKCNLRCLVLSRD